ncbi:MAG: CAP domain-containing protein [Chthoniobacterales bacterium]
MAIRFLICGLLGFLLANATAQLSVNPVSREESRIFYEAIYPVSENIASGWNGDVAVGDAGTTTSAFKNAVYLRVNYFRAMAGVPGGIVDNASFSAGAQQAALMMSSNGKLSHTPTSDWINYSSAGATAAGKSNIALGNTGSDAINEYMEDSGATNTMAGHRRWILYPQSTRMGTGDVPATGSLFSANALWVQDSTTFSLSRPTVRDTFVAWPPKGYVPYTVIYPRWSFSYPGANFSSASVSLQRNGSPVSVTKETIANGYGENTLVFIPGNLDPDNWPGPVRPSADTATSVTISNVVIGGTARSFSYTVTAFDPLKPGSGTVTPVISGPSAPVVGTANAYSVNALPLATGYQWKRSTFATYNTVTGAEADGLVRPTGYSVRDNTVQASGSYSYHLAQPGFVTSQFVLNAPIVPGSGAALNFQSRLGYATSDQVATVQVSLDNGLLWDTLWTQPGTGGAGEGTFQSRTISLAAYSGREIQIRFLYNRGHGSAYPQTSEGVGWYVDNISLSGTQTLGGSTLSGISASQSYSFTPSSAGTYALQVRPQVYGNYLLGWSAIRSVSTSGTPPPVVQNRIVRLSGYLAFGTRRVRTRNYRTLTIWNDGNAPLTVSSIGYRSGFSGAWSGAIAPGGHQNVRVIFRPTSRRSYVGNVTVRSDATGGVNILRISGRGR